MSTILNIETSSKNCSVCLSSNGELISSFDSEDITYKHSELLTSSIQNILNENNLSVKDLSAVSVGIGPGSFTGLRIGLSAAQELQKKQMDLMTPLLEKARNAITKVGEDQGFNYVIDSSPNGGIILANGKDLLADVKKELGF